MVTTHTPDPAGDANIDQTYSAIRQKMMESTWSAIYESDVLFLKDYDVMLHKTDHATFMTKRSETLVRLSHVYLGSLEANDTYWLCQWELSVFISVCQPGMDVEFMGSVVGTSDAQLERLHIKQGLNPLMVIISSDGSHCAPHPLPMKCCCQTYCSQGRESKFKKGEPTRYKDLRPMPVCCQSQCKMIIATDWKCNRMTLLLWVAWSRCVTIGQPRVVTAAWPILGCCQQKWH